MECKTYMRASDMLLLRVHLCRKDESIYIKKGNEDQCVVIFSVTFPVRVRACNLQSAILPYAPTLSSLVA
jgi:hypothetical protein